MNNNCEMAGDNRFEIIKRAKDDLLKSTNIEMAPDEMACLNDFLFRCWQMGWLKQYEVDIEVEEKYTNKIRTFLKDTCLEVSNMDLETKYVKDTQTRACSKFREIMLEKIDNLIGENK